MSKPPPPPHVRQAALVEQKEALQKKHANTAQYQYLCWIPFWVPIATGMINPKPVVPGREIYVLWFRAGTFVFALGTWLAVRVYLNKLKKQIAAIDAQLNPPDNRAKPPIAAPF